MKIKTISDLLNYVETEEKAHKLIYYISILEEQLQQKENIIKEVREKVNKYPEFNYSNDYMIFRNEIKGILDKENKQ